MNLYQYRYNMYCLGQIFSGSQYNILESRFDDLFLIAILSNLNHYHFNFQVYISTSDVQMHANYHRKDSAILQEGFQRFRATESCSAPHCMFAGQRTTHFHCRRPGCTYTFKNKADMGKY